VAVWDGEALVGQGAHERYVIEVERFLRKLRG
jgi:predicted thioesterase